MDCRKNRVLEFTIIREGEGERGRERGKKGGRKGGREKGREGGDSYSVWSC